MQLKRVAGSHMSTRIFKLGVGDAPHVDELAFILHADCNSRLTLPTCFACCLFTSLSPALPELFEPSKPGSFLGCSYGLQVFDLLPKSGPFASFEAVVCQLLSCFLRRFACQLLSTSSAVVDVLAVHAQVNCSCLRNGLLAS